MRNRTDRRNRSRGFSFAEILLVFGLAGLVVSMWLPGFVRGRERSAVANAVHRMNGTAIALDAYYIDYEAYPACGSAVGEARHYDSQQIWQPRRSTLIATGVPTIHSSAPRGSGAAKLITFRTANGISGSEDKLATLTTPIAYMISYPTDPFAQTPGATFGYFAHESHLGWILFSLGPDRDENSKNGPGDISPRVAELYNISTEFPYMWQPPPSLINAGYDPTNGLFSNGDLYHCQGQ